MKSQNRDLVNKIFTTLDEQVARVSNTPWAMYFKVKFWVPLAKTGSLLVAAEVEGDLIKPKWLKFMLKCLTHGH